jgi:zinc transporter ZupT
MTPVLLAFATFISTFLGGFISLRNRHQMHLVMGFAAGTILGVVSFNILPEIIEMVHVVGIEPVYPMVALVGAFLGFHVLEKILVVHHSHEDTYVEHKHPNVGIASALALIGHSFMDGVAIGLGFQVSPSVGVLVAIAVIAHDFTDGMNMVALMLRHKNTITRAKWFLFIDALAAVIGAFSTLFFTLSPKFLLIYLGCFAGFLLYIGVADILPEAHSKHSSWKTVALTVLGATVIFLISQLSHHSHL